MSRGCSSVESFKRLQAREELEEELEDEAMQARLLARAARAAPRVPASPIDALGCTIVIKK